MPRPAQPAMLLAGWDVDGNAGNALLALLIKAAAAATSSQHCALCALLLANLCAGSSSPLLHAAKAALAVCHAGGAGGAWFDALLRC